jgi:hypothetical protein
LSLPPVPGAELRATPAIIRKSRTRWAGEGSERAEGREEGEKECDDEGIGVKMFLSPDAGENREGKEQLG